MVDGADGDEIAHSRRAVGDVLDRTGGPCRERPVRMAGCAGGYHRIVTDRTATDIEDARFEFRAWGDVHDAIARIDALDGPADVDRSQEVYLVGPERTVNAKVRDGRVEAKHLVDTRHRFQRWRPAWESELPCTADEFHRLVSELTGSDRAGAPSCGSWSQGEIRAWFDEAEHLDAISVRKVRTRRDVDGVGVEVGRVDVDRTDVHLTSVAVESVDLERVERVRDELGLTSAMNIPMHVAVALLGVRRP